MIGTVKFKIKNNHRQHQLNTRALRHFFPSVTSFFPILVSVCGIEFSFQHSVYRNITIRILSKYDTNNDNDNID